MSQRYQHSIFPTLSARFIRVSWPLVLLVALVSLLCSACSDPSPSAPAASTARLSLAIDPARMAQEQWQTGDSLQVQVSGPNMRTMSWRQPVREELLLEGLPPGASRLVEAVIADTRQRPLYVGEATVALGAGANLLRLALEPQFLRLVAQVPLGLQNPLGIAGGELRLQRAGDTLRAPLQLAAGLGTLALERVFFADDWLLQVSLWDSAGTTLFRQERLYPVGPTTPAQLALDLSPLQTGLQLQLQLGATAQPQVWLTLPGSQRRSPTAAGEVLFSELFPYPKISGDAWEWFELYNSTADTLALTGCLVTKTRGSTAASTSLPLPDTLWLPPARVRVLGRDSVNLAHWRYGNFTLSNTRQSLLLLCDGALIDSLAYQPPEDTLNPFPLYEGRSVALNLTQWEGRLQGSNWCAPTDTFALTSTWKGTGTPGVPGGCAGVVP